MNLVKWCFLWVVAWFALLGIAAVLFLALEMIGLHCEWSNILGCSTLSALLSNWPVQVSAATGSLCCTLTIHWFHGRWMREGKRLKLRNIFVLSFLFAVGYGLWVALLMLWGAE